MEKDYRFQKRLNLSLSPSEEEPQEACSDERTALHDTDYLPSTSAEPHLITQMELNDLIRDLDLPKNKAEVLGSRLKQWSRLASDVRTSL